MAGDVKGDGQSGRRGRQLGVLGGGGAATRAAASAEALAKPAPPRVPARETARPPGRRLVAARAARRQFWGRFAGGDAAWGRARGSAGRLLQPGLVQLTTQLSEPATQSGTHARPRRGLPRQAAAALCGRSSRASDTAPPGPTARLRTAPGRQVPASALLAIARGIARRQGPRPVGGAAVSARLADRPDSDRRSIRRCATRGGVACLMP